MARMTNEQRLELVRALRFDAGHAEAVRPQEIGSAFYPVAEHLRALEPEVVLIVGDRGAGKSMLKSAATDPDLREAIVRHFPKGRWPAGETNWLDGYPLQAQGPDAAGWEHFASAHRGERTALQELWFAYLARTLGPYLDTKAQRALDGLLKCPGGDAEQCFIEFQRAGTAVLLAVDRLDQALAERERWIFIAYDELDTILFSDWEAMGAIIRSLVSFWVSYARRWQRIRAKLFLRTDFYRHHSEVVGADIAKLAANRVELSWSDKNLYAVLIKHIANRSDELRAYCRQSGVDISSRDVVLQYMPRILKTEDARPFVERLVGEYMGADRKKGQSFTWILDHVRDGNGKALPRSLVRLIEFAAMLESDNPRARGRQLIHPVSLRNALDKVSERHVREATNEFRWLPGVKQRLAADQEVPWTRKELEALLRRRWDESWSEVPQENVRPPSETPHELVDYLIELGIFRNRGRERYDVPDLFLAGLELRRRGGVSRS